MNQASTGHLLDQISGILARKVSATERLNEVCLLLANQLSGYDWVGFYVVDPLHPRELILGPFAGEPTAHVRIPFGRGICGQAAETGRTFVIDDVLAEENYLACSVDVNSEIVVPVRWQGTMIGELDIDSHSPRRFSADDRLWLEALCSRLAPVVEEYRGGLVAAADHGGVRG